MALNALMKLPDWQSIDMDFWVFFSMQASFRRDTIDVLSEFRFVRALQAFILSLVNSFCLCDRNSR